MFLMAWLVLSLPTWRVESVSVQVCYSQSALVSEWTQGCQYERSREYGEE